MKRQWDRALDVDKGEETKGSRKAWRRRQSEGKVHGQHKKRGKQRHDEERQESRDSRRRGEVKIC